MSRCADHLIPPDGRICIRARGEQRAGELLKAARIRRRRPAVRDPEAQRVHAAAPAGACAARCAESAAPSRRPGRHRRARARRAGAAPARRGAQSAPPSPQAAGQRARTAATPARAGSCGRGAPRALVASSTKPSAALRKPVAQARACVHVKSGRTSKPEAKGAPRACRRGQRRPAPRNSCSSTRLELIVLVVRGEQHLAGASAAASAA